MADRFDILLEKEYNYQYYHIYEVRDSKIKSRLKKLEVNLS